jgi:hypothetical protein
MIFFIKAARLLYFFALLISPALVAQPEDLNLHTERGNLSNDGRIKLIWGSAGEDALYELQSATDETFETPKLMYKGPDRASFVSGLKNGTYYYRVKSENSSWSKTLVVEVEHHSIQLAMILFAVGGIVFLLTVAVVVEGTFRAKKVIV